MATLIYPANVSLDGYIEDADGTFDWLPVDDEVFDSHTELIKSAGTLLYGRRLHEMMAVWETDSALAADSPANADFAAAWQALSKIVYSRTLDSPTTAKTRIESEFEPRVVEELKSAADRDILIGGAEIAGQALTAGLIDEIRLYVLPVIVGSGKPGLPTETRMKLELLDEKRFGNGVVLLRYRVGR